MTLTERVLDGLGEAFNDAAGPLLPAVVDGLAGELEATDTAVALHPRGWADIVDLDTTPYPRWLGQVAGARPPAGLTDAQARAWIRTRRPSRRGTPEAIREAVRAALTGTRRVDLVERNGSPWRLTVQVYASELAAAGVPAVLAAARTQKPVGIIVDVDVLIGATVAHMRDFHGPTVADYAAAFPTVAAARDHVPEPEEV